MAEQAGGYGSNGHRSILVITPEEVHQRTALFVGQRQLVGQAERYLRRYDER